MAFPKKSNMDPNKKIPIGEEGKKYIEELKTIREDLEKLKSLTEQVKSSKLMPPDMMNKINGTIEKLKSDVKKLNQDFPDLGFGIGE